MINQIERVELTGSQVAIAFHVASIALAVFTTIYHTRSRYEHLQVFSMVLLFKNSFLVEFILQLRHTGVKASLEGQSQLGMCIVTKIDTICSVDT